MKELIEELQIFVKERDWEKFHAPKNLAMALSVEVSEIVEMFQWMTEEESWNLSPEDLQHLEEEIGDVMTYLTHLALKFGLNPIESAKKKMVLNRKKYPAPSNQVS